MKPHSAGFYCVLSHRKSRMRWPSLNHRIRAGIWRKALRSGTSIVGVLHCLVIDVDSHCENGLLASQGVSVGYNPHKRRCSFVNHPLLTAFWPYSKEILQGWLRDVSAYTKNGVVDSFISKRVRQLLESPSKSDSHSVSWRQWFFCGGPLLDFLEERGHGYLIKVKLKGLVSLLETQKWQKVKARLGRV